MTQKEKAKLVPVSREPALLTERDADKSPVLECIDLGITFGGLKAVDNFNVTIGRTEITGLIGPNGAGKTTVFNLLTKVYQPTHGTILLNGKDIHDLNTAQVNRAGIARTFQNIRLFGELSVEENITVAMDTQMHYTMPEGIFRLPRFWKEERVMHERAMELLSIFHMEDLAKAKASSLPYGAQRRLEIVRALATNPSLLLKAAGLASYSGLIDDAIAWAKKQGGSREAQVTHACDKLAVNFGAEILKSIPGRVSTEVDARLSFNREKSIEKARHLVALYQEMGIDKSRILIKLASTWEGIRAAEVLEKEGIHCNLTLLFSFAQARACAEAGVYLISPFVGRIYDWYQARKPLEPYVVEEDPGVKSVRNIYDYFKQHKYNTIVMGASFRRTEQILALVGCDRLTIAPPLLKELQASDTPVVRKLIPASQILPRPVPLSEAEFRWEHNQDPMAVEKLAEGIRLFAVDQRKLEDLLAAKLSL